MKYCVSCHSFSNCKLKHKKTGEEYPFCRTCIKKAFYNKDIFDVIFVKDVLDIMSEGFDDQDLSIDKNS